MSLFKIAHVLVPAMLLSYMALPFNYNYNIHERSEYNYLLMQKSNLLNMFLQIKDHLSYVTHIAFDLAAQNVQV